MLAELGLSQMEASTIEEITPQNFQTTDATFLDRLRRFIYLTLALFSAAFLMVVFGSNPAHAATVPPSKIVTEVQNNVQGFCKLVTWDCANTSFAMSYDSPDSFQFSVTFPGSSKPIMQIPGGNAFTITNDSSDITYTMTPEGPIFDLSADGLLIVAGTKIPMQASVHYAMGATGGVPGQITLSILASGYKDGALINNAFGLPGMTIDSIGGSITFAGIQVTGVGLTMTGNGKPDFLRDLGVGGTATYNAAINISPTQPYLSLQYINPDGSDVLRIKNVISAKEMTFSVGPYETVVGGVTYPAGISIGFDGKIAGGPTLRAMANVQVSPKQYIHAVMEIGKFDIAPLEFEDTSMDIVLDGKEISLALSGAINTGYGVSGTFAGYADTNGKFAISGTGKFYPANLGWGATVSFNIDTGEKSIQASGAVNLGSFVSASVSAGMKPIIDCKKYQDTTYKIPAVYSASTYKWQWVQVPARAVTSQAIAETKANSRVGVLAPAQLSSLSTADRSALEKKLGVLLASYLPAKDVADASGSLVYLITTKNFNASSAVDALMSYVTKNDPIPLQAYGVWLDSARVQSVAKQIGIIKSINGVLSTYERVQIALGIIQYDLNSTGVAQPTSVAGANQDLNLLLQARAGRSTPLEQAKIASAQLMVAVMPTATPQDLNSLNAKAADAQTKVSNAEKAYQESSAAAKNAASLALAGGLTPTQQAAADVEKQKTADLADKARRNLNQAQQVYAVAKQKVDDAVASNARSTEMNNIPAARKALYIQIAQGQAISMAAGTPVKVSDAYLSTKPFWILQRQIDVPSRLIEPASSYVLTTCIEATRTLAYDFSVAGAAALDIPGGLKGGSISGGFQITNCPALTCTSVKSVPDATVNLKAQFFDSPPINLNLGMMPNDFSFNIHYGFDVNECANPDPLDIGVAEIKFGGCINGKAGLTISSKEGLSIDNDFSLGFSTTIGACSLGSCSSEHFGAGVHVTFAGDGFYLNTPSTDLGVAKIPSQTWKVVSFG